MLKVKEEYRNSSSTIDVQDPNHGDAYLQITARAGGIEARRSLDIFGIPHTDIIMPITLNENEDLDDIIGNVIVQNKFLSPNEIEGVFSIPRLFLIANEKQNLGTLPSIISVDDDRFYDLKFHIDALIHDVMLYLFGEIPEQLFGIIDIILLPQADEKLKQLIADTYRDRFETEEEFEAFKSNIKVGSSIYIDCLMVVVGILDFDERVPELSYGAHEYRINSDLPILIPTNDMNFYIQNPFIDQQLLQIYTTE